MKFYWNGATGTASYWIMRHKKKDELILARDVEDAEHVNHEG